jgi:hypothetical protein
MFTQGVCVYRLDVRYWVFTLHFPRVLGLYGIPGAPTNPAE